ncbi:MAG: acyloxyacyl hydrolase [Nitrospirae bacterium]|nr:acyloxyacyl hydrolase [Nitrospirota bacterium]
MKKLLKAAWLVLFLAVALIALSDDVSAMEAFAEYGRGDLLSNGDSPWSPAFARSEDIWTVGVRGRPEWIPKRWMYTEVLGGIFDGAGWVGGNLGAEARFGRAVIAGGFGVAYVDRSSMNIEEGECPRLGSNANFLIRARTGLRAGRWHPYVTYTHLSNGGLTNKPCWEDNYGEDVFSFGISYKFDLNEVLRFFGSLRDPVGVK